MFYSASIFLELNAEEVFQYGYLCFFNIFNDVVGSCLSSGESLWVCDT